MTVCPDSRQLDPPAYVDAILHLAAEQGASDLYWLPGATSCAVRIKCNGLPRELAALPPDYGAQCVSRIKVLAGMLTYRCQSAQDGVFRQNGTDIKCEFRVASMPTLHGERLTLRLLDSRRSAERLDELGFTPTAQELLRSALRRESGMTILTGPTGCGKTTTIYALVRELLAMRQDPASIISLEDPIECEIPGITQSTVGREEDGWGYSDALRAALRQDVKTLIIGEMRDRDIVRVALEAALTGHRVITTFHAGDIPGVWTRLLHQGFEPFLVAAAVTAIATQRLLPVPGGGPRIPLLAGLLPDDAFREFIIGTPDLAGIRARVAAIPGADIHAVVRQATAKISGTD